MVQWADKPDTLCRQSIFIREYPLDTEYTGTLDLKKENLLTMLPKKPTGMAAYMNLQPTRIFADDSLICVVAQERSGDRIDLTECVENNILPLGKAKRRLGAEHLRQNTECRSPSGLYQYD